MFIIFGWPSRKIGEHEVAAYCHACQRDTMHKAFTRQNWFTLFFIPILPISAKSPHAICNVCGLDVHGRGAAPGARPLAAGLATPMSASRLTKRCPACAEEILLEATVCRFCGRNLSSHDVAQALEEQRARAQAATAALQQAAHNQQQQEGLKRLRAKGTRRLIFGVLLSSFGAMWLLIALAMLLTSPSPGNTAEGQRNAAIAVGCVFGFVPLAAGIALLWAASKLAKRSSLPMVICPRCQFMSEQGVKFCGHCGETLTAATSSVSWQPAAQ